MNSPATLSSPFPLRARAPRVVLAQGPPTLLLLGAVSLVVILISMPRLAHWAAATNQEDAAKAAMVLGPLLADSPGAHTLNTLVRSTALLRHRFKDARPLGSGHLVAHHGYLLARGSQGTLFAWPSHKGRTGNDAYAWTPGSGLLVHRGPGPGWSGVQRRPEGKDLELPGWQPHN